MKTDHNSTPCPPWRMLVAGLLILAVAGCASTGEGKAPAVRLLAGTTWQWIETVVPDGGAPTVVPTPEKFSLVFREDGTYSGLADCNVIGGRYSREDGFKMHPGMSTRAFCGEKSLDQKFLKLLGQTTTAARDNTGRLILESDGGRTRMIFRNGGDAP